MHASTSIYIMHVKCFKRARIQFYLDYYLSLKSRFILLLNELLPAKNSKLENLSKLQFLALTFKLKTNKWVV